MHKDYFALDIYFIAYNFRVFLTYTFHTYFYIGIYFSKTSSADDSNPI